MAGIADGVEAKVVWSPSLLEYRHSADHPISPRRLDLTMSLATELGVLQVAALVVAVAAGVIRRTKDGVRLLGTGEVKAKLNLVVWSATAGAKKAIEAAGGSVVEQRIEAEAKAAARVEKRNAAKGKAPAPKAPKGDANKVSARAKRTAAKA